MESKSHRAAGERKITRAHSQPAGPQSLHKTGEEGWRPALAKTKQKLAMLTSRLSLTLEKRPRAPAQVCSANKTLAALGESWSTAVGPPPAFLWHLFGRLSEWLSCSLYAVGLSGRRPAWLQTSSVNTDFIELETGLLCLGLTLWVFGNLGGWASFSLERLNWVVHQVPCDHTKCRQRGSWYWEVVLRRKGGGDNLEGTGSMGGQRLLA